MDNGIQKVGVIGCGTMGAGIVQVCITHGFDTVVVETSEQFLESGLGRVRGALEREVSRGRMPSEDRDTAVALLRGTTSMADLADRDLVIEAAAEDLEIKRGIFAQLAEVTGPEAILASNTSSLSISELAGASGRPGNVIGLHFFNPPAVLKLIEIVATPALDDSVRERAVAFCQAIDRVVVEAQDTPGFVVNRLLIPFVFDAIRLVETGTATPEAVDDACRAGLSHTMGPLATADLIGLDVLAAIGDALFEEYGEARFKPPTRLRRLLSLNHLGRKTGQGFFTYG